MKADPIAFIGDIHGNVAALRGLLEHIEQIKVDRVVFLGDYIDKGPDSADVIQYLVVESGKRPIVLLKGNHENVLLEALDTGNLTHFLKIGGASTIRSYVKRPVGPDVITDFRSCLPPAHVDLLRQMSDRFEHPNLIASHVPIADDDQRYRVSAHVTVGLEPVISSNSARIDTGCGSATNGRLTAFMWPSLTYLQVNAYGLPI